MENSGSSHAFIFICHNWDLLNLICMMIDDIDDSALYNIYLEELQLQIYIEVDVLRMYKKMKIICK